VIRPGSLSPSRGPRVESALVRGGLAPGREQVPQDRGRLAILLLLKAVEVWTRGQPTGSERGAARECQGNCRALQLRTGQARSPPSSVTPRFPDERHDDSNTFPGELGLIRRATGTPGHGDEAVTIPLPTLASPLCSVWAEKRFKCLGYLILVDLI
jgi:hypothetical protein